MTTFIESLKTVKDQHLLEEYADEDLRNIRGLLETLAKAAGTILAERAIAEQSDPEYIEVVVAGQRDRIKRDVEVLNISCNNFTRLPEPIYQLKNLKKLYLFNNQFSEEEKRLIRQRLPRYTRVYF